MAGGSHNDFSPELVPVSSPSSVASIMANPLSGSRSFSMVSVGGGRLPAGEQRLSTVYMERICTAKSDSRKEQDSPFYSKGVPPRRAAGHSIFGGHEDLAAIRKSSVENFSLPARGGVAAATGGAGGSTSSSSPSPSTQQRTQQLDHPSALSATEIVPSEEESSQQVVVQGGAAAASQQDSGEEGLGNSSEENLSSQFSLQDSIFEKLMSDSAWQVAIREHFSAPRPIAKVRQITSEQLLEMINTQVPRGRRSNFLGHNTVGEFVSGKKMKQEYHRSHDSLVLVFEKCTMIIFNSIFPPQLPGVLELHVDSAYVVLTDGVELWE